MEYSIGDKVVHPGIGAGEIVDTKHQELVDGFEQYYVIEIPLRGSTVYMPMRKMDEMGVRPVISESRLLRVFEILTDEPRRLPKAYKKRQKQIEEKLKTGEPAQVAEAVRDLIWHEHWEHLTKKDTELLNRGRKFLASEIAMVTGAELEDINEILGEVLDTLVSSEGDLGPTAPSEATATELPTEAQKKRRSPLEWLKSRTGKALAAKPK